MGTLMGAGNEPLLIENTCVVVIKTKIIETGKTSAHLIDSFLGIKFLNLANTNPMARAIAIAFIMEIRKTIVLS